MQKYAPCLREPPLHPVTLNCKAAPMEKVLILDFGGQYNQLIARRVRECKVYCEVHPYTMPIEAIKAYSPIGIIFTGGPGSVYEVE